MKSLDITQDNEGAVYAIFRFLKSVIELSDVIGYYLICLVYSISDSQSLTASFSSLEPLPARE